jgi:hypothetical protein
LRIASLPQLESFLFFLFLFLFQRSGQPRARGIARQHAYRLIDAAGVITNLSPIGDIPTTNHARDRYHSLQVDVTRKLTTSHNFFNDRLARVFASLQ